MIEKFFILQMRDKSFLGEEIRMMRRPLQCQCQSFLHG